MTLPAHSKVGFSSRKRWASCPGSIKLSEGIPSRSSKHAEEGTAAHALQEHCLLKGLDATDLIGQDFAYEDHGEDKAIVIEQEMAEHIQRVLEDIRAAMATDPDAVLLVEERFHLHQLHSDLFGTGDVAIWFPRDRVLQVRDLKYGAGVAVDIEDENGQANQQLEGYALGVLLKYPEWKPVRVEMVIDQPRAPHAGGFTRSTSRPVSYFVDMAADLVDEVRHTELAAAERDEGRDIGLWIDDWLNAGDHCRFCPAAPICPLIKSKAQEVAKMVFAPQQQYNAAQLAEVLDWLPILDAWIKNVREFAYAEAEKGHDIPNYKLVEKRATRKWRDESAAEAKVAAVLGEDAYAPAELKSPAAIEKLLSKEQRAMLDELCVKESTGHTLVHESDRREAVKLDAKSAFENA